MRTCWRDYIEPPDDTAILTLAAVCAVLLWLAARVAAGG